MPRQATRYAINHPIEIAVTNERHHVITLDVSRNGMFLGMTSPVAVGTTVRLAMPDLDQRRLYTRGTVVRAVTTGVGVALREPCEPADELFGLGIERLVRRSTATQIVRPPGAVAALCGDLRVIGLPAILTLLEHERQTGRLQITHDRVMWIDLVEGRIVDGGIADVCMDVHACVMAALDHKVGRFEFLPCEVTGSLGLMPITYLLLEHARRSDELRATA